MFTYAIPPAPTTPYLPLSGLAQMPLFDQGIYLPHGERWASQAQPNLRHYTTVTLTCREALRNVPPMNRLLLCLALIAALVSVQTLSLHAHLASGEADSAGSHPIHVHSHTGDASHHGEAEPGIDEEAIDLLTSTAARDSGGLHFDLAVTTFLTLLLVVVWHRRRQRPRIEPPVHHSKPTHRRPSPRAPPLLASPF